MRKVKRDGPLEITYGVDTIGGFFLNVCDTRLRSDIPPELEGYIEDRFPNGDYIRFKVDGNGIGDKISVKAMRVFWRKFGISEEECQAIMGDEGTV